MTMRDRLAEDLLRADDQSDIEEYDLDVPNEWFDTPHEFADRLIDLGWVRLDEERLARALHQYKGTCELWTVGDEPSCPINHRHDAAAIIRALRTGAVV